MAAHSEADPSAPIVAFAALPLYDDADHVSVSSDDAAMMSKEHAAKAASLHGVVPADMSTQIKGHNFAIQLLKVLDGSMRSICDAFYRVSRPQRLVPGGDDNEDERSQGICSQSRVNRQQFIDVMLDRVLSAAQSMSPSQPSERGAAASPSLLSPRRKSRSIEQQPPAPLAPAEGTEYRWFGHMTEEDAREELGFVFDATDAGNVGTICFDELVVYIVDCALHGDVGYVAEVIPAYGTKGSHYLRAMDEIATAVYAPELGKVLSAGKCIGIIDLVASQTFTIPYPQPEALRDARVLAAAGGKVSVHATTGVYGIDYVPHMNAVVVAGTDRGLHVVDLASCDVLFTIPTPEPCTSCVFDRTSSTVVSTSRTYHVRCFRLAAHRHSDRKFEMSFVFREHTDMVTIIRALGRDGLVASAGMDGRVVVYDVRAGLVFTRFSGHSGETIGAMCFVSTFGYMATCGLRSEPRVWVVSPVTSRSDCFILSDSEAPHVERVSALCDVPESPQLLSMDRNGMIKVWDLRSFHCVQTIRADRFAMQGIKVVPARWHTLVYDTFSGSLCALSKRRLQLFTSVKRGGQMGRTDGSTEVDGADNEHFEPSTDLAEAALSQHEILRLRNARLIDDRSKLERRVEQSRSADAWKLLAELDRKAVAPSDGLIESVATKSNAADDFPLVAMSFNMANNTLMTASDRRIGTWDVYSGKLESRFDRLPGAALDTDRIAALCVSTHGRSFIVGLRSGRIAVHTYSTAGLLQVLVVAGNGPEVLKLTYLHGAACVVAGYADSAKIFFDRPSIGSEEAVPPPCWLDESRGVGVMCVCHDPLLGLLAVGERRGELKLFEGRRGQFTSGSVRLIAAYTNITTHDLVALAFLQGYPAIAVSDSLGQVHFVTLPPHAFAGRCFARISLRQRLATHLLWYPQRSVMYTGMDTGLVAAVELSNALLSVNLTQLCTTWEAMVSSCGRSGTQPRWVEELAPRRVIQAHGDAVTGLLMVPGSGLVVTSSVDRKALAWTVGLFFRGELDSASPFGRYAAVFARPVDGRVTGYQRGTGEDLAVLRSLRTKPPDDDWDTVPQPLPAAVGEPAAADELVRPPAALVLQGGRVDGASPVLSTLEFVRSPAASVLQGDRVDGAASVLSTLERSTASHKESGQLTTPSKAGTHLFVSAPRAMPRRIVELRRQLTEERAVPPDIVIESAADEEEALLFNDRLMAFISPDVQAAMAKAGAEKEPRPRDTEERKKLSRSVQRARDLLLVTGPGTPEIHSTLPSELPDTTRRHARPALAVGYTAALTSVDAGQTQALPVLQPYAAEASAPLLSPNSCGVDFHTVFSFGPSDPRKRLPKAYVVETYESAGEAGGLRFAVTQDHPTEPSTRAARDYEIRRLIDAEDARRERLSEAQRLQETLSALAEANDADNAEMLRLSSAPHRAISPTTNTSPLRRTGGGHAPLQRDPAEVVEWGEEGRRRRPPKVPLHATVPLFAPDHLNPVTAAHIVSRVVDLQVRARTDRRRQRRLLPADLLRRRKGAIAAGPGRRAMTPDVSLPSPSPGDYSALLECDDPSPVRPSTSVVDDPSIEPVLLIPSTTQKGVSPAAPPEIGHTLTSSVNLPDVPQRHVSTRSLRGRRPERTSPACAPLLRVGFTSLGIRTIPGLGRDVALAERPSSESAYRRRPTTTPTAVHPIATTGVCDDTHTHKR